MLFLLKKIIGLFVMPYPFVLISLLVGLALLNVRWASAKVSKISKWTGRGCLMLSFLAFVVFSNAGICSLMILRYETRYAAQPDFPAGVVPAENPLSRCKYVLVLGAGSDAIRARSSLQRLSPFAQMRLTEGIRIARALPDSRLVVSGGGIPGFPSAAQVSEAAAVSLGFPQERIVRFDETADTRIEIKTVKKLAGDTPIALVTTAFHLPRAMQLCKELGVEAVPCPGGYALSGGTVAFWDFVSWTPMTLGLSATWFHELLGSLFA